MPINAQPQPFDWKIYSWLIMGCILLAVSIFFNKQPINILLLFYVLQASILGGLLVVIKHRFRNIWFFFTILCLLVIIFLKDYLFSKGFRNIFLNSDSLIYLAGFYCLFYGICLRRNRDIKILKIITVLSIPAVIPLLVLEFIILCLGQPESEGVWFWFATIWYWLVCPISMLAGCVWIILDR